VTGIGSGLVSVEESVRPASAPADRLRPWLGACALGAVAAGGLHLAAAAQHLEHGDLVVGFFLLVAAAQVGGGVWLALKAWQRLRPDPRLLLVGVLGTVALIGLFVVAHSTDLLLGYVSTTSAHGGHTAVHTGPFAAGLSTRNDTLEPVREAPGVLGTLTVALEVAVLMALAALLPRRWSGRVANCLLALGGLAWMLWLTGLLG
jgi:hypothetical protein